MSNKVTCKKCQKVWETRLDYMKDRVAHNSLCREMVVEVTESTVTSPVLPRDKERFYYEVPKAIHTKISFQ